MKTVEIEFFFIIHKELSKLGKDRGTWELLQQEEEQ